MFEKMRSGRIKLHCDVCGKESKSIIRAKIDTLMSEGWRFTAHSQSNGYRFFGLFCSDACQNSWEEHTQALHIISSELIRLSEGVSFWVYGTPRPKDNLSPAMIASAKTGSIIAQWMEDKEKRTNHENGNPYKKLNDWTLLMIFLIVITALFEGTFWYLQLVHSHF